MNNIIKSGIYCILNLINGKLYIGQTTDLKKRKHDHFRHLRYNKHHNYHLQNAFNEYGGDNFDFVIITYCSEEELNDLEQYYIAKFKTMDNKFGYNLDSGGLWNRKLSHESVEKMSKSLSTNYNSVGFYRVYKQNKKDAIQGFQWCYRVNNTDGRRIQIRSTNLLKVKEKVILRGLEWFVTDEKLAKKSLRENERNLLANKKGTNTGFYRVSYNAKSSIFQYQFTKGDEKFHKTRTNLDDLKKEVLDCGWEWKIIDEEKASKFIKINKNNKIKRANAKKSKNAMLIKKLNKSGFYNVYKSECESCLKGFIWNYRFDYDNVIKSVELFKLKEKVLARGWIWKIVDEEKAKKSIEINNQKVPKKPRRKPNKSGFYHVYRIKNDSEKGFMWVYEIDENQINGNSLNELKYKVLLNGFEWRILDKEKAKISWNRDKGIIPSKKVSKRNNTGFLRVSKIHCERCFNKILWKYDYGTKSMSSVDLNELKQRVVDNNWEWKIVDGEKAKESMRINKPKTIKTTNTGFYRVSQVKRKNCKNGFTWRYYNKKQLQSTNLLTLKNKVVSEGLEWKIENEELAINSVKIHNFYNLSHDNFDKFNSVTSTISEEKSVKHPKSEIIATIKKEGTGFLNVYLSEKKAYTNGIQWIYYTGDNPLTSVDLLTLKDKVLSKGLEWEIVDKKKAKRSLELNEPKKQNLTNSGFYKVFKRKCKKCKQGFTWVYDGKKVIRSIDLCKLKDKVLSNGLEWKVEDVEKAKKSFELNKKVMFKM